MKKLIGVVLVLAMALGIGVMAPSEYSKYGIRIVGENVAVSYQELLAISQKSPRADPKLQSILNKRQAETVMSPQELFEISLGLFTEADKAEYLESYRNCTLTITKKGSLTRIQSSPIL